MQTNLEYRNENWSDVKQDKVSTMFDLHQKANEENKELRAENSKGILVRSMETKIKTAFIGALSSFENHFGYLWGHGEIRLTQEQEQWKEEWQLVRKEILDKGNDQIKLARSDLNKFDVKGAIVKVF